MIRRGPLAAVVVAAVALAAWLVVRDLDRYGVPEPEVSRVAAGTTVDIDLAAPSARQRLVGSFRLESVRDHARLEPQDEYEDPIGREGGRVVVATLSCECPATDDLMAPTFFAVDAEDRRWESVRADTDAYAELAGLAPAFDLGEAARLRFAVVFVVPTESAAEVDVLVRSTGGEHLLLTR